MWCRNERGDSILSFRTCGYKDIDRWRKIRNEAKRRYAERTGSNLYEPKHYTEGEDKLILEHSIPDRFLANKLGRSVSAIQMRRCRLRKEFESDW